MVFEPIWFNIRYWYIGELQWSYRSNLVDMRPLVVRTIAIVILEPIWFKIQALVHGRIALVISDQFGSHATIRRWDHCSGHI